MTRRPRFLIRALPVACFVAALVAAGVPGVAAAEECFVDVPAQPKPKPQVRKRVTPPAAAKPAVQVSAEATPGADGVPAVAPAPKPRPKVVRPKPVVKADGAVAAKAPVPTQTTMKRVAVDCAPKAERDTRVKAAVFEDDAPVANAPTPRVSLMETASLGGAPLAGFYTGAPGETAPMVGDGGATPGGFIGGWTPGTLAGVPAGAPPAPLTGAWPLLRGQR